MNLHPSRISEDISNVFLIYLRILVCFNHKLLMSESCNINPSLLGTRSCILTPSLRLNSLLVATQANLPNIIYDLRQPQIEDSIFLPYLNSLPNTIDFCQLITSPPVHHMTIWHRNLPWSIYIEASQPNGITIYDLFLHIHRQLHQPIAQEDYYTDELAPSDREMLIMAFQIRCAMFPDQLPGGVRRIDFLGPDVCFIGLKGCRRGKWEFKTQPLPPKERMMIVSLIFYSGKYSHNPR